MDTPDQLPATNTPKGDSQAMRYAISVVTPTLRRPQEITGLLENLSQQRLLPSELIVVDGAPPNETTTEEVIAGKRNSLPFKCKYVRHGGGTAIQRNVGIERAQGDYVALIDDDIRLEAEFLAEMVRVFDQDPDRKVGGITGYITNQHLDPQTSKRWRLYRLFRLFTTYEPGRYDFVTGYPINRYLQPPHLGVKEIDFMGAGCALWRREVFDSGLRFSEFFTDFGVLEDAHLALRARRQWKLLECGRARCLHLASQVARMDKRRVWRKTAVNYRFVFVDIVRHRTLWQEFRFWRVQVFDLCLIFLNAVRKGGKGNWLRVLGKLEGIIMAWKIRPSP